MIRMQLAFLCAIFAAPLCAQTTFDADVLSTRLGVFCEQETVDVVEAPGTALGIVEMFEGMPEFLWDTHVVPAAPGISFGTKSQMLTEEVMEGVIITTTHPPFKNDGTTQQSYVTNLGGRDEHLQAYTFDFPWEQVTGRWVVEARWNGQLLYRSEFEVVDPALLPHITHGCGGAFLS